MYAINEASTKKKKKKTGFGAFPGGEHVENLGEFAQRKYRSSANPRR